MITLRATLARRFDGAAVFLIHTHRTFYSVTVTEEDVTVLGPGVAEAYSLDRFPDSMSDEGKASVAVLLWEESE